MKRRLRERIQREVHVWLGCDGWREIQGMSSMWGGFLVTVAVQKRDFSLMSKLLSLDMNKWNISSATSYQPSTEPNPCQPIFSPSAFTLNLKARQWHFHMSRVASDSWIYREINWSLEKLSKVWLKRAATSKLFDPINWFFTQSREEGWVESN